MAGVVSRNSNRSATDNTHTLPYITDSAGPAPKPASQPASQPNNQTMSAGGPSFTERASLGASNMVDSARRLLGVEPQPRTWMDELEDTCCGWCPALTWQQRLFGCLMCFIIGACGEKGEGAGVGLWLVGWLVGWLGRSMVAWGGRILISC